MSVSESQLLELKQRVNTFLQKNDLISAQQQLIQLAKLLPKDVGVLSQLAWICLSLGDSAKAISLSQRVLSMTPDSVDANYFLAMAYGQSGQTQKAREYLARVVQLEPGNVNALVKLAYTDFLSGQTASTLVLLTRAQKIEPDHVELNINFGRLYTAMNEFDKAYKYFQRALAIEPDHVEGVGQLASLYSYNGENEKAYQILLPHLRKENVAVSIALVFAGICRSLKKCEEARDCLEQLLESGVDDLSKSSVQFALGKILDREQNFDLAFKHYHEANQAHGFSYNAWEERQEVQEIIKQFTTDYSNKLAKSKKLGKHIKPIFIVGMPRSGTSLVEQILSSHPLVYGAGERMEILDIVRNLQHELASNRAYPFCLDELTQGQLTSKAKRYLKDLTAKAPPKVKFVTDKMPDNYKHLALIQQLFPKAKILHCVRNPLDNCLSCYFTQLMGNAYSYNLKDLGTHYGFYQAQMEHWKKTLNLQILDVQYEEMVASPEKMSREITEFCGLPWDDACLDFHKNKRGVVTASSDQVRQPIYTGSVERWKHYQEHIGDLIEALKHRI